MTRGMIYRLIFICSLIVFSVMLILPTVGEKSMQIELSQKITPKAKQEILKRFKSDSYKIKKESAKITVVGTNINSAVMNDVATMDGVLSAQIDPHWAENALKAKPINLGLDLQGGMHLVLRANFEKIEEKMSKSQGEKKVLDEKDKNEITQQALELLRNRIDKFGVSEPSIRPRGNEAIEIQLPGVKDPEGVKNAIGKTGRVEYRLVDELYTKKVSQWVTKELKKNPLPLKIADLNLLSDRIADAINLPRKFEVLYFYSRDKDTNSLYPAYPMVLERKVALGGTDISKAWIGTDEYGGNAVHFTTTAEGAAKFANVTSKKNHGKRLAIIIDDKVRSAPNLNVQISSGKALISGDFTAAEVRTLTRIIKEGALPVDLKIIEERTVGPSLGQDSIESGISAIKIGFLAVIIFMVVYYKLAGVISGIGLLINMILMLALLSWMGFTLTLPGIAGFILTVGMAVDANVIIYERIKEEIRNGKSVRMSVVNGFDKAYWTIFDANLTTLIAAFILSQFGTGPIKGFAVTLFIGIITSMFVALYITRFIYEVISLNKKTKKLSI